MSDGMVLLHVVPLAAVAALSPALLGASVEVLIVFRTRGVRMLAAYLLGSAAIVGLFLAGAAALPRRQGARGAVVQDVLDVVLAAVLLALAAILLFRRPRPPRPGRLDRLLRSRWAAPGVAGLGAAMMVTNISTLTAVVAGAHEAASAASGPAATSTAFALLAVGALAPILFPLLWAAAAPVRAASALHRLDGALGRHGRSIGIVVCLATAAYLLIRGLGGI